MCLPAKA